MIKTMTMTPSILNFNTRKSETNTERPFSAKGKRLRSLRNSTAVGKIKDRGALVMVSPKLSLRKARPKYPETITNLLTKTDSLNALIMHSDSPKSPTAGSSNPHDT